jgi:hypothetical protein
MHLFLQGASETVDLCPNALIHKCKMYAFIHVCEVYLHVHTCIRGVCVCLRVFINICMYTFSVIYMRHGNTYCNTHCNREGRSTHTHKHVQVHIFTLRTSTHTCTLQVHVQAHILTYISTYKPTNLHTYCMYVCMYAYMHVCRHMCQYICMYFCIYVCAYICMYVRMSMYRCMYVSARIKFVCLGTCTRAACMHANTLRILLFVLRHKDVWRDSSTHRQRYHRWRLPLYSECYLCFLLGLCPCDIHIAMWSCAVLVKKH